VGSGFENLNVVVVSALGLADVNARGGLPDGVRFFQKPVDFVHLQHMVRYLAGNETLRGPLVS
jgi:hypothetical protein